MTLHQPCIPTPPQVKQGRGRPIIYSERLFLKALVIMIVKHLHSRVRGRVLVAQEHQPLPPELTVHPFDAVSSPDPPFSCESLMVHPNQPSTIRSNPVVLPLVSPITKSI
jgi:hypothetical protein